MGPPAEPSSEESSLADACLEVEGGPEKGQLLPLSRGTTTLGRSPGNTHVIADATMSRQHAKVFVRADRHWVADLNSSHGTFVNGTKVTLQTLVDGDEVKVGSTVLRYHATKKQPKAAPTPTPPSPPPSIAKAAPVSPVAPAAPAAPAAKTAGMSTGSFELELPADAPAASPASRGPLPPLATNYRRALTPEGEDPFALEQPAEESASAPASSPAGAPASRGGPAPAIEMRGETARQFASRGAAQPASVAATAGVRPLHAPPPLAQTARRRGTFTFLRDELDQRGPLARTVAAVFALAAAGALFWIALRIFDSAPKSAPPQPEEGAPTGPSRPVLPTRK